MNNYRMWAYALIATGLLNWDYQRSAPNIAAHSLAIIIPGALLLLCTFVASMRPFLALPIAKIGSALIGIAALAYAFLN